MVKSRILVIVLLVSLIMLSSISFAQEQLPEMTATGGQDPVVVAQSIISKTPAWWSPLGYLAIKAKYKVGAGAAMYGGSYLLLESPQLVTDLVTGGFYKIGYTITKDAILNMIETSIKSPKVVCKELSSMLIREGLSDYKIAYDIARSSQNMNQMSKEEAIRFLQARWGIYKLTIAEQLYSASVTTNYSISQSLAKKETNQVLEYFSDNYQKSIGIDNALPIIKAASFIKDLTEILESKKTGIMNYPPYIDFINATEKINKRRLAEAATISESEPSIKSNVINQSNDPNHNTSKSDNGLPSVGLIAYFPFNGNANDQSGKGNNGRISGAKLSSDRFNHENDAFYFDGQSSIVVDDNQTFDLYDFTFCCWIRSTSKNGLVLTKDVYGQGDDFNFGVVDGLLRIELFSNTQHLGLTPIDDGQWHFIVGERSQGLSRLFVDGRREGQRQCNNEKIRAAGEPLKIGAGWEQSVNFTGSIDDVRIYNRALTEDEVQSLFHENGW